MDLLAASFADEAVPCVLCCTMLLLDHERSYFDVFAVGTLGAVVPFCNFFMTAVRVASWYIHLELLEL